MEDDIDLGHLFAEVTAAAEDAATASVEGHTAPSITTLEQTRKQLVRALLILNTAETALRPMRVGPAPLIDPSALAAAIEQNHQLGLDFNTISSIHEAKPGGEV
ncbi:hypothetical protein [Maricaulis sp.]|uniref:hypothetical protein n=1 Tax=Maricaulis sp. TaxID=1486257 RepID=UPI0026125530|nr:hypothetical protein [Maricaulis sp.]